MNTKTIVYENGTLSENIDHLSAVTAKLATDGFGRDKEMSSSRMKGKLEKEGSLIMVYEGGVPIAFQTQKVFEVDGKRVMYYSRVVSKDYQGRGVGTEMLAYSIDFFKPDIVAARSQNPVALYSSIKESRELGAKVIFPFDLRFDESQEAEKALNQLIAVLEYPVEDIVLSTGIHKGAYGEKKLGDYEIRIDHPGIKDIERRLTELGLERINGDAVFHLTFLD